MKNDMLSFKDMMVLPVENGEDPFVKYRRQKYRKTDTTSESVEKNDEVEEELSVSDRLQRSRNMKKNKARLALARKKAMRRSANMKRIKNRASKSARKAMFMKLSKGKKPSELPMARRKEIEKRLNQPQFQKRLSVVTKRSLPKVRGLDRERKSSN
jgi:hypothetical protein